MSRRKKVIFDFSEAQAAVNLEAKLQHELQTGGPFSRLNLSRKAMGAAADAQALREECKQLREQLRQSVSKEELRPTIKLLKSIEHYFSVRSGGSLECVNEIARLQKLMEAK